MRRWAIAAVAGPVVVVIVLLWISFDRIGAAREEAQQARADLLAAEQRLTAVDGDIATTAAARDEALSDISELKEELATIETERDEALAEIAGLKAELATVETERDEAAATAARLGREQAATDSARAEAAEELQGFRQQAAELEGRLAEMEAELTAAQGTAGQIRSQYEAAEESNRALRQELDDTKATLDRLRQLNPEIVLPQ